MFQRIFWVAQRWGQPEVPVVRTPTLIYHSCPLFVLIKRVSNKIFLEKKIMTYNHLVSGPIWIQWQSTRGYMLKLLLSLIDGNYFPHQVNHLSFHFVFADQKVLTAYTWFYWYFFLSYFPFLFCLGNIIPFQEYVQYYIPF